jgi:hypothetical protein
MRPLCCAALCVLLLACGGSDAPSAEVLPRDRFTAVLCDLQLVEARVNHELVVEPIGTIPTQRYSAEVFERHGVTKEEFQASMAHYSARHAEMTAIYEDVIAELSKRRDGSAGEAPTSP